MDKFEFKPDLCFTKEILEAWLRPCVYAFFRKGKLVYVGSSKNGIVRPLHPKHECKGRRYVDEVRIQFLNSEEEIRMAEKFLIRKFRPKFNFIVPTSILTKEQKRILRMEKLKAIRRKFTRSKEGREFLSRIKNNRVYGN